MCTYIYTCVHTYIRKYVYSVHTYTNMNVQTYVHASAITISVQLHLTLTGCGTADLGCQLLIGQLACTGHGLNDAHLLGLVVGHSGCGKYGVTSHG